MPQNRSNNPISTMAAGEAIASYQTLLDTISKVTAAQSAAAVANQTLARSFQQAGQQTQQSSEQTASSIGNWADSYQSAYGRVQELNQRHLKLQQESVSVTAKTVHARSTSVISALKSTAFYRAYEQAAAGFGALGSFDFWSAAQHFTSASLWGTLAGIQVASALGGGSQAAHASRRQASGTAALSASAQYADPQALLAQGAASALAQPAGQVTILVGSDNAQLAAYVGELVNTHVSNGGKVTSSHTLRPPPAGS